MKAVTQLTRCEFNKCIAHRLDNEMQRIFINRNGICLYSLVRLNDTSQLKIVFDLVGIHCCHQCIGVIHQTLWHWNLIDGSTLFLWPINYNYRLVRYETLSYKISMKLKIEDFSFIFSTYSVCVCFIGKNNIC